MHAIAITPKRKKNMCCIAYHPEHVAILKETIRESGKDYRLVERIDRLTTRHEQREHGETLPPYTVDHAPPGRGKGLISEL